ncbi:hypothetical protein [Legionella oakridgensis]|uniref:hypothetical protein n=1 Tax=Legionella oakridgensis TaxID=29423 RepID=UPI0012DD08C6|nr:hypothetical protein [Legionella oakridgensis]
MMPAKKLTDRQLAELYFGLARHYDDCIKRQPPMSPQDIYNELYNGVYYTLNYSDSPLRQLEIVEQQKIYTVLNTFFYACPQYRVLPAEQQIPTFFQAGSQPRVIIHHHHHHYPRYYSSSNDVLFTWLLLNSLTPRPYYYRPYPHHGHFGPHHHAHASERKKDEGNVLALLLLIALVLLAAALAFVALYYLLSQTMDNVERFCYSEGWLQAGLNLMGMVAGGVAASLLTTALLTAPLAALALAAGIANPVGVVIFGMITLTLVGAAAGGFLTDKIQQYFIKKSNEDALDPQDPHRFALTEAEERALMEKGIDPIKVKCAIVALRAKMEDKPVPSLLNRLFSDRGQMIQDILNQVRELRSGKLKEIQVGEMHFNCRSDGFTQPVASAVPVVHEPRLYQPAPLPPQYATFVSPVPSAPLAPSLDSTPGVFPGFGGF